MATVKKPQPKPQPKPAPKKEKELQRVIAEVAHLPVQGTELIIKDGAGNQFTLDLTEDEADRARKLDAGYLELIYDAESGTVVGLADTQDQALAHAEALRRKRLEDTYSDLVTEYFDVFEMVSEEASRRDIKLDEAAIKEITTSLRISASRRY